MTTESGTMTLEKPQTVDVPTFQPGDNVEEWNDSFARQHDIDAYYEESGWIIRYVENSRCKAIRSFVDGCPGQKILEVGCGGGHILQMFPEATLTGVDVSGVQIDKARRRLQGYKAVLLKGDVEELGLVDGSFDSVICTEVLEHVVDPEAILASIQRFVRPGGTVVITFPNDQLINRLKNVIQKSGLQYVPPFRGGGVEWGGSHYHIHVWSPREMRNLLEQYFTVKKMNAGPNFLLPLRYCFKCTTKG